MEHIMHPDDTDDDTDLNVIGYEAPSHPYEDFSDQYENIFDSPEKHAADLLLAVELGNRDVFERLLPKVVNHGEVAVAAYTQDAPRWAEEVVRLFPDANYQEYFEALLNNNEVPKALALWWNTGTTLSRTSRAFDKHLYDQIDEEYLTDFRDLAETYLTDLQLTDCLVRAQDSAWLQRCVDQNLISGVLNADQLGLLVDQNAKDTIDTFCTNYPHLRKDFEHAARAGNPALFNALVQDQDNPTQDIPTVATQVAKTRAKKNAAKSTDTPVVALGEAVRKQRAKKTAEPKPATKVAVKKAASKSPKAPKPSQT